jgi:hypothetical protein
MNEPMRGVLCFHSETGTEGGYWAFQDGRHITTRVETRCRRCGSWWNPEIGEEPDGDDPIGDTGFVTRSCKKGEHDVGDVVVPSWSYEGLNVLKDGDVLTIFDKADPTTVVWSGTIEFKGHPLFTEEADGYWIHADQVGVLRDTWARWFFEEYPAELVKV